MDILLEDLRHSLRRLAHRPGTTIAAVVILGLGIGVSTAVFSVVRRILLRPIPVSDLDRLVVAWERDPSRAGSLIEVSLPYFFDWRTESRSFEDLAAFGSVNWGHEFKDSGQRESVPAAAVSASFFETLRARPLLGRTFLPQEDESSAGGVLVLSYGLWQRRFSGDPGVIGRRTATGDTIVGVMPKEFDFPQGAQVWKPVAGALESARRTMESAAFRGLGVLYVVGRLEPGVSLETARTELGGISKRLSIADQFSSEGWSAEVVPLVDHYLGASTRRVLEALAAASVIVLMLACANVAVLLLVQAIAGRTGVAVRRAVGASVARVVLQHAIDGTLLAFLGGALGILLARSAVQGVVAFGPSEMPGLRDLSMDGGALAFALLVTLLVSVLVTVAPGWLTLRLELAPLLRSGGGSVGLDRRGWNLSRVLVTAEVALSIVLLVGSGLLVRSLGNLLRVELGFLPDHALSFSVERSDDKPPPLDERSFVRALIDRLAALPEVAAAGAVFLRPLEHGPIGTDAWVLTEGTPLDWPSLEANHVVVNWEVATPDYFRAVGTRVTGGRTFSEHDTVDVPKVVIVSESLAHRGWPGENPLGKRLHTHGAKGEFKKDGTFFNVEWMTVVGVVEDARYRGIQNPRPVVYLPYQQAPDSPGHFVVRTAGDPLALVAAVREQVRAIDPGLVVGGVTTLARLVDRALAPWRFASALLSGFGIAALALTMSGLFAVLHRFVSGRTREIAIRMALGAAPRRVRTFILRQGLALTALGLALGLGFSLVLARSLSALLYGVSEKDGWSYLGAAALLSLAALPACLLPARRATQVDPVVVLRSE